MPSQFTNWSDAVMTSLAGAVALLFGAMPRIIGFALILIVGWIIASLIGRAVGALLRAARFNTFAERAGMAEFMQKGNMKSDACGAIATIAKWFVRLIVLVVAFDALGVPAVSDILRQLLMWLPNVVVALMVLVIGGIAAAALGNVVRGAAAEGGLERPDFLAAIAKSAVWAFTVMVAVSQLGVATALINILFMATVGALALAIGLSFGLGARDTAAGIVRKWYERGQPGARGQDRPAAANQSDAGRATAPYGERRAFVADRRIGGGRGAP
jgi:hypothetical protein